jgi:hypothetical protein
MTDEAVKEVVVEGAGKAGKSAKVKKEKVYKEPRFSKKWTAETWAARLAEMTRPAVPEGWLGMAEIVSAAVAQDIKRSRICSAMGGDRCANAPWEPVFQVVYVGGRKYGSPEILTKGFALLKDPEFHKVERKGRAKKEKGEESAVGPDGKTPKIKRKLDPSAWNAKQD